jgi:hypothetical protein
MDVHLGEDFHDSFIEYQTRMLKVFDRMSQEYGFHVLDASTSVRRLAASLKRAVTRLLEGDLQVPVISPGEYRPRIIESTPSAKLTEASSSALPTTQKDLT